MKSKLLVVTLTLLFGLGLAAQPVLADEKQGNKGHGGGYGKGHGYKGHGYKGHGGGYGGGYGHRHGTTGHLIRGLLAGADEMGLTDDQVKKLKAIQLDLDRTRIKTEADIKVAEREARALIDDESASLSAVEGKLKESAKLQVSLRMAAIKARRDAMAVLTPEQSKRVKMFHEQMRKHMKSGGYGHGKGHGGMKGKKEDDDD